MPTPTNRTPLRVARGTYSNLNSSVSDIQEGEIVYATDQDKLYVKEGSSLVSTQASVPATNAVTDAAQLFTAAQRGSISTLSAGQGSTNIGLNANIANNFVLLMQDNYSIANPSALVAGQSGSIFIVQDGTGNRTASWGSYWDWPGGVAPTLSTAANAVDRVDYIVRSTTSVHAVFTGNYS
tara:strand:+ start:621 stop:1163 length:543 start_codon:yes stop_codon:yes gene_type:complete